jgi:hypothetical protein
LSTHHSPISSAERALNAVGRRPPSASTSIPAISGIRADYAFVERFADRIYHAHEGCSGRSRQLSGVFGGHLARAPDRFGSSSARARAHRLRDHSPAERGAPTARSIEWEDIGMDREHGAKEARVCSVDRFPRSWRVRFRLPRNE